MSFENYFVYPRDLEEIYSEDDTFVVPDTNFLLSAYQWRDLTTEKVKNVLQDLSKKGRLKLLEHVLYEFVKNRQKNLLEQIRSIDDEMKRFNDPKKYIREFIPTAENSSEVIEAQEKRENLYNQIREYKKSLKKLKDKIQNLVHHDEYYNFIKSLCATSFVPYSKDKNLLKEEGLKRISQGIKPGTNEMKSDPTGDYIIWHEMIQLKKNIIFVSNDQKKDWVYKDLNGVPFGTDQTLLTEFHSETEGKSFIHVLPSKFIKYLDPQMAKEIEVDLNKQEKQDRAFLKFAIQFSQIDFGEEDGEVTDYWEFKFNRLPRREDSIKIGEIFNTVIDEKFPVILINEGEQEYWIMVDCSHYKNKIPQDEIVEKIKEVMGSELIRARYYPLFDRFYDHI